MIKASAPECSSAAKRMDALDQISQTPFKDRRTDTLLRLKSVLARTGLSKATIYRLESRGAFPARQQIGPRCVAWYESDVADFVENPSLYRLG